MDPEPQTEITLKDGSISHDVRLNRIPLFDPKSRNFPIMAALPQSASKPRSYTWRCLDQFDQGHEGACVGFGIGAELAARPSEITGLTNQYLKEAIYWQAQRDDPWDGGSYPGASPFYEGTAVLSGVKVAQGLGYFTSYRWSFSLDELILGIGYSGPAVLGLVWYEGMFKPDENDMIHVTGRVSGGHCICARGVDIAKKRILLRNSWGSDWGINGDCWISFDDMDRLLHEQGEACFFLGRKKVPKR